MKKANLEKEYSLCLPTAQILDETDGEYIVGAEVFGTGLICEFVVRGTILNL